MTAVHEMTAWVCVKRVKDVITSNGDNTTVITFLPMRRGFVYPDTSAGEGSTYDQRIIRVRSRLDYHMIRRLECGVPFCDEA